MNLLCAITVLLVLGSVHCYFDIGPCTNPGLDSQSCSFHFDDRDQTCTDGSFSLMYENCDTTCSLDCDLHPPRNFRCEDTMYLLEDCMASHRGYCRKDCGISTYVTSYKDCDGFPGWLMCPDYCCCGNTCGGGQEVPPGQTGLPGSCPNNRRHFQYGTCDNRQGGDNDLVCPPVKCPDTMHYLEERCVCVTKESFPIMDWHQAKKYCATNYPGGTLMKMRYQSEFDLLTEYYTGSGEDRLWLGVSRDPLNHDTFRYDPDGRKVTANLWMIGEPNNNLGDEDCVEIWNHFLNRGQGWNDQYCDAHLKFICEIEPYMMPLGQ